MNILLTNDDGIYADGILEAAEELCLLGNVTVVAPSHEQSAVSSKITVHEPLRVNNVHISSKFKSYCVSGTPADCVKLAIAELCDEKPDLVVSGINQGSNTGFNLIYSGTVAGAVEGMLNGIPSIAISLTSFLHKDFTLSRSFLSRIVPKVHAEGLPYHTLLNINIPPVDKGKEVGVKWCKLSQNRYIENFEKKLDPIGKPYYWLGGTKLEVDTSDEFDDVLIKKNYITIVPVKFEFNDSEVLNKLRKWEI